MLSLDSPDYGIISWACWISHSLHGRLLEYLRVGSAPPPSVGACCTALAQVFRDVFVDLGRELSARRLGVQYGHIQRADGGCRPSVRVTLPSAFGACGMAMAHGPDFPNHPRGQEILQLSTLVSTTFYSAQAVLRVSSRGLLPGTFDNSSWPSLTPAPHSAPLSHVLAPARASRPPTALRARRSHPTATHRPTPTTPPPAHQKVSPPERAAGVQNVQRA